MSSLLLFFFFLKVESTSSQKSTLKKAETTVRIQVLARRTRMKFSKICVIKLVSWITAIMVMYVL